MRELNGQREIKLISERFHARKEKNAMDLRSQRVLMKLILFHCLANTSDEIPLPLPLVTENDDTLLEKKKLRPKWVNNNKKETIWLVGAD